jgi:hypothetical protein
MPGRTSPWARLLSRAPGAASTDVAVRFASGVSRATELSLGWVLRGAVGVEAANELVRWEAWAREAQQDA